MITAVQQILHYRIVEKRPAARLGAPRAALRPRGARDADGVTI